MRSNTRVDYAGHQVDMPFDDGICTNCGGEAESNCDWCRSCLDGYENSRDERGEK